MSKYTTELRFICETEAGLTESVGYNSIQNVLDDSYQKIFSFDYPIFDTAYKPILEKKILKHFYTREICEETYGLWKLRLDAKMNEIMPYYNQLYESELLEFNPLYDTDVTTTGQKIDAGSESVTKGEINTKEGTVKDDGSNSVETSGTDTVTTSKGEQYKGSDIVSTDKDETYSGTDTTNRNETNSGSDIRTNENDTNDVVKNDHWDYYSDTPQGTVSNLANLTYLTNARHITDDGTGSNKHSDTTDVTNFGKNVDSTSETEYGKKVDTNAQSATVYGKGIDTDIETGTDYGKKTDTSNDNTRTYDTTDINSSNTDKSISNLNDYTEHVVGKRWADSYSDLLTKFRNTFLNIDQLVLDELEELFFGLW